MYEARKVYSVARNNNQLSTGTEAIRKTCAACGNEYLAVGKNRKRSKYCYDDHYCECCVCGTPVKLDASKRSLTPYMSVTCSDECKRKLKSYNIKKTFKKKYGVENASQIPGSREKAVRTMKKSGAYERIGLINSDIWKSKTDEEKRDIVEKRKLTSIERYGVDNPAKNESVKDKIRKAVSSEEAIRRYELTSKKHYGTRRPAQSVKLENSKKSPYSTDAGLPLDSSWELCFYQFLKSCGYNDSDIERNVPIEYADQIGKSRVTFIDFKVDGRLFEVKGSSYLKNLVDTQDINKKLEIYRSNNVVVVTSENVDNVFGSGIRKGVVPNNSLIGVDRTLFNNPVFPLDGKKPLCFYKTKVHGNRCMYDAFNDPNVRWKMILNRLKYRGGFITAKDVVNAMNVTRTCKQPSWFSKSYAKKLISKYCSSDVIVDPFAGWGSRHDASIELGRYYVGIDCNPDVVEWHKSLGRNIKLADIESVKYNGLCSVFSCPPYSDTEVYFHDMKVKTESEWIDVVLKNVPNAVEYVFVCGTVDTRYRRYIVEEKLNKSHYGSSVEYVLVIPGNPDNSCTSSVVEFEADKISMRDTKGNVLSVPVEKVKYMKEKYSWVEVD